MLVLSVGLQKTGSGWYFNLKNDLLIAAGHQDVRDIREKFNLKSWMKYYNCNIDPLTEDKLTLLSSKPLCENTFVVKTHSCPIKGLNGLISIYDIKITCIYRDPRDIALSAYEHGKKIRASGESHTFAGLKSIEDAILWVSSDVLSIWEKWEKENGVLMVRYEDLLTDTYKELKRTALFMGIDISTDVFSQIINKYKPENSLPELRGWLHYNQGVSGRSRKVMNSKELDLSKELFKNYLSKMGYPL